MCPPRLANPLDHPHWLPAVDGWGGATESHRLVTFDPDHDGVFHCFNNTTASGDISDSRSQDEVVHCLVASVSHP